MQSGKNETICKIQQKLKNKISFACYCLPHSTTVHFIFEQKTKPNDRNVQEFCVRTWNKEVFRLKTTEVLSVNYRILRDLAFKYSLNKCDVTENTEKEFITLVKKVKQAIQETNLRKAVASRAKVVKLNTDNIFHILANIIQENKKSFKYLLYLEGGITWLGASPEELLVNRGKLATTIALAGTKSFDDNIFWTRKEVNEQQLVANIIAQQLRDIGKPFTLGQLKTTKSANLAHLSNEFSIRLNNASESEKIALILHPSPAIGGFPKQEAINFINSNEMYDRDFYTGIIGIKNPHRNSNFFYVNIRCMQIFQSKAAIYVGAGITTDSDPLKEWEETELKSQTLGKYLY